VPGKTERWGDVTLTFPTLKGLGLSNTVGGFAEAGAQTIDAVLSAPQAALAFGRKAIQDPRGAAVDVVRTTSLISIARNAAAGGENEARVFEANRQANNLDAYFANRAGGGIYLAVTSVGGAGKLGLGGAAESVPVTLANPRNLRPIQGPVEMTGSKVKRYASDMRANGYDPAFPVDAARVDGRLIIIDGHHRTEAAIKAGLKEIPVRVIPISPERATQLGNQAAEAAAQRALRRR
jgi:hypothetical protein